MFFGTLFVILSDHFRYSEAEYYIGFGCMLSWFSITKYFANTKDYSVISRTFSIAIPLVLRVMIGAAPVLIAFTFLSVCLFWPFCEYFDTIPNAAFSLFACMNGDSVGDIFTGTTETRLVFGQIFTYVFTILGMCFIQNLNLICVEDSYLQAKYSHNYSWLHDKEQDENKGHISMIQLIRMASGGEV